MKLTTGILTCIWVLAAVVDLADAAYIKGQNWADRVVSYTTRIQRFGKPGCTGGVLMNPHTTWWILGPNDCDQNGDMDAWSTDPNSQETIDYDYAAGWKGGGPLNKDQELVVWFNIALEDYENADDLVIRLHCGYKARASVWASIDRICLLCICNPRLQSILTASSIICFIRSSVKNLTFGLIAMFLVVFAKCLLSYQGFPG